MADQRGRSMRQQPAGHNLPGMFFDFINRPQDFSMASMLQGPRGPLVDAVKSMPALNQAALATAPVPVVGDLVGLAADARMYATDPASRTPGNAALSMLGLLPFIPGMTVFHGTPHRFMPEPDAPLGKFRLDKIGTGEGAQAYGHGIYVAESPDVAGSYQRLGGNEYLYGGQPVPPESPMVHVIASAQAQGHSSKDEVVKWWRDLLDESERASRMTDPGWRQQQSAMALEKRREILAAAQDFDPKMAEVRPAGSLYSVDLPDEQIAKMLDWDAPLSEQPESVRQALFQFDPMVERLPPDRQQFAFHQWLRGKNRPAELRELGIPGIRYLDGNSRRNMARLPYQEGLPSGWQFFKNKYGIGIKDDKGLIQTDGFASEAAAHRHIFGEKGTRNFVLFDPDVAKIVDRK